MCVCPSFVPSHFHFHSLYFCRVLYFCCSFIACTFFACCSTLCFSAAISLSRPRPHRPPPPSSHSACATPTPLMRGSCSRRSDCIQSVRVFTSPLLFRLFLFILYVCVSLFQNAAVRPRAREFYSVTCTSFVLSLLYWLSGFDL